MMGWLRRPGRLPSWWFRALWFGGLVEGFPIYPLQEERQIHKPIHCREPERRESREVRHVSPLCRDYVARSNPDYASHCFTFAHPLQPVRKEARSPLLSEKKLFRATPQFCFGFSGIGSICCKPHVLVMVGVQFQLRFMASRT